MEVWLAAILSVTIVSLLSFVGVILLGLQIRHVSRFLLTLVGFAAGALLGDVFIHLLPELAEEGISTQASLTILAGILTFFVLEKFVQWRHCHVATHKHYIEHPMGTTNLVGDALHNFIDGAIIAASYIVSIPVGIATTIAVILHEIPQEIGDFGVLLHSGMSVKKAVLMNFLSAMTAIFGAIIVLVANGAENLFGFMVPFTIGGFLYIAGSDLLPELHKREYSFRTAATQLLTLLAGIGVMYLLVFLE